MLSEISDKKDIYLLSINKKSIIVKDTMRKITSK